MLDRWFTLFSITLLWFFVSAKPTKLSPSDNIHTFDHFSTYMFKLINDLQLIFYNFTNTSFLTVHQWFKQLCKNCNDHILVRKLTSATPPLLCILFWWIVFYTKNVHAWKWKITPARRPSVAPRPESGPIDPFNAPSLSHPIGRWGPSALP